MKASEEALEKKSGNGRWPISGCPPPMQGGQRPAGPSTDREELMNQQVMYKKVQQALRQAAHQLQRQGPGGRPGPGPEYAQLLTKLSSVGSGREERRGVQGHDQQAPGRAGRQDENVRAGYVGDEPGGERTGADRRQQEQRQAAQEAARKRRRRPAARRKAQQQQEEAPAAHRSRRGRPLFVC